MICTTDNIEKVFKFRDYSKNKAITIAIENKNKYRRAYEEAREITKYEIIDQFSLSITYTLFSAMVGSLIGHILSIGGIGEYELLLALGSAFTTFMYTCPKDTKQIFERNLEKTLKKYLK